MMIKSILYVLLLLIYPLQTITVSNIIDGDTLNSSIGKIRLTGINTPEKGERCFEESKEFLKSLLIENEIELRRDFVNRDKYNRLLRFVTTPSLNEKLIENGYAKVYFIFPNYFMRQELINLEINALQNNLGCLWKESNNTCTIIDNVDKQSESVSILNLCNESVRNLIIQSDGRSNENVNELCSKCDKIISIDMGDFVYLFDEFGFIDFERV